MVLLIKLPMILVTMFLARSLPSNDRIHKLARQMREKREIIEDGPREDEEESLINQYTD